MRNIGVACPWLAWHHPKAPPLRADWLAASVWSSPADLAASWYKPSCLERWQTHAATRGEKPRRNFSQTTAVSYQHVRLSETSDVSTFRPRSSVTETIAGQTYRPNSSTVSQCLSLCFVFVWSALIMRNKYRILFSYSSFLFKGFGRHFLNSACAMQLVERESIAGCRVSGAILPPK